MRLNEKLKSLRASKNLTQENLATKLGVTRQTISKWEKGISVPDADVLSQIADIFEVSVAELLGSEEKEEIKEDHVAQLLATMNEEMAAKNKHRKTMIRLLKIILMIVLIAFVIPKLLVILFVLPSIILNMFG